MKKIYHYLLLFNIIITFIVLCFFVFILSREQIILNDKIVLFGVAAFSLFLGYLWISYLDFKKELVILAKQDELCEENEWLRQLLDKNKL